jgi:broad specificity phosphatase PhoE
MARLLAFAVLCCLLLPCVGQAQTIFVARHAERTGEPDPPLNEDGQGRAVALAKVLVDAHVVHFYTSDQVRARQTAEPTAKQSGRTVATVPQDDFDGLIARVRATAKKDEPTLVIGHRGTVPRIVKALGGGDIEPLKSDEHDRLIVLVMQPDGSATVVTLRY